MRSGIAILLIIAATLSVSAQNSPGSASPALQCAEGVVKACAQAAAELGEARKLIDAQAKELEALTARLAIEQERYSILKQQSDLRHERAEMLNQSLAAEREAGAALKILVEKLQSDLAKTQRRYGFMKKVAAGGFLVGLILGR